MFERFTMEDFEAQGATIRYRRGGDGPPLLLLHGNPLTHVSWHKIADRLAEQFTVVAADLRGYGDSSCPAEFGENYSNHSFRAMAQDQVELMEHLGLTGVARVPVAGLPYGTQKRVETARALISQPRLLLLDEPFEGLAPVVVSRFTDAVIKIKELGISLLIAESHLAAASRIADRIYAIDRGEIIFHGTPDDFLQNDEIMRTISG